MMPDRVRTQIPLRGEVAKLADAEPGVEQGPDEEPFGGRLAGIGQTIRSVRGPDEDEARPVRGEADKGTGVVSETTPVPFLWI
jgi:hypothetical protein